MSFTLISGAGAGHL